MPNTPYDLLWPRLWPKGARPNAWAIIDCARDPQVWSTLYSLTLQRECLYAGALHPQMERVAPYLVQLEFGDSQTMRLLSRGWGNSWGTFLRCGATMQSLRKHLRKFLRVTGPQGKNLVFRYYDPRVMRVFLPTCSAVQLDQIFGPIECILAEDDSPEHLLEFSIDDARQNLLTSRIELAEPVVTAIRQGAAVKAGTRPN